MHTVIQRDWEYIPCGKDGLSRCLEEITNEEIKNILAERLGDCT